VINEKDCVKLEECISAGAITCDDCDGYKSVEEEAWEGEQEVAVMMSAEKQEERLRQILPIVIRAGFDPESYHMDKIEELKLEADELHSKLKKTCEFGTGPLENHYVDEVSEECRKEFEERIDNDYHSHKFDQGKTDWGLIPVECYVAIKQSPHENFWAKLLTVLAEAHGIDDPWIWVRKILEHGAEKYGRESWKTIPDAKQRYFAAYMRHMVNDKDQPLPNGHIDPDSGYLSVYHALTNCIFLLWFELNED